MMSNRGIVLLAVGMLVLGMLLGGLSGGVAGYFMGRNTARSFGGQFNLQTLPNSQTFPNSPNLNPQTNPNFPFTNPNSPNNSQRGNTQSTATTGARVIDVEANGAAEKAGLKIDDVITAVGGAKIDDNHPLADLVKAHKPGENLDFSVTRGNQTLTVTVQLGTSPTDSSAAYLGIRYAPVTQSQGGRRFQ
jgi:membrane-associated protease RseP (regulator of RpoE activity)